MDHVCCDRETSQGLPNTPILKTIFYFSFKTIKFTTDIPDCLIHQIKLHRAFTSQKYSGRQKWVHICFKIFHTGTERKSVFIFWCLHIFLKSNMKNCQLQLWLKISKSLTLAKVISFQSAGRCAVYWEGKANSEFSCSTWLQTKTSREHTTPVLAGLSVLATTCTLQKRFSVPSELRLAGYLHSSRERFKGPLLVLKALNGLAPLCVTHTLSFYVPAQALMVGLSARDLLTVPRVPPKRNGAVAFADNVPKLLKHTSTTHQRDSLSGYLLFSFFLFFLALLDLTVWEKTGQ